MEQYRTTRCPGYCFLFSLSLSCVWIAKYAVTIPLNYSVPLEKVVELFHSYLMGPRIHYNIGHAWFNSYCLIPSVASVWCSAIRNNIYWRQALRQNFQLVRTGTRSHPTSYSVDTWESTIPTAVLDCVWNVMAHAQNPDFVFRRKGRVHLNRQGRQFSRLLAA